ncbi:MAG TPA: HAMP domain-containing sensor histidine kinase [Pseudonocardia sp.]|nr:HAMP domain-containing sensor histidine kinase [Pseudonocardia sp.]
MRQLLVRLTVAACATAAGVVVVAAVVLHEASGHAELRAQAEADAAALVSLAEVTGDETVLQRGLARTVSGREGRLAVHAGGQAVGRSRAGARELEAAAAAGPGEPLEVPVPDGTLLLRAVPAAAPGTVVEVFVPDWRPGPGTAAAAGLLALAGLGGTLAGRVVTRRSTLALGREVEELVEAARALGDGKRPARVRATRTPQTAELAWTLGAIADRIDDVRAGERRLVADLSHRLRTPLTALALDVDALGEGPVEARVRRAVASLENGVDTLIRAARPDRTGPAQCDVVEVVRRRMAFWAALGGHRGRRSELTTVEPPAVIGLSAEDLAAVFDALLGNVFRYTPDGTPFAVSVVRHAGWITLVVDDAGPGVADPAEALRRGVSGSGSTGLGLDIARDAVAAAGGTIHVERAALGGARIRLRFAELGVEHDDPREPRAWRLWHERRPRPQRRLNSSPNPTDGGPPEVRADVALRDRNGGFDGEETP